MAVSVTLRNTFLEVADAPIKRRARASSSPLVEDSCEETVVPSEDSGESCDERAAPSRPSPAASPLLCPWPSTPELLPMYRANEPMLPLPPCAEDALLPPSFEPSEEVDAAMWDMAWSQMWSMQHPDTARELGRRAGLAASAAWAQESWTDESWADCSHAASASWAQEAWTDEPWADAPQERATTVPRQSRRPVAQAEVPRTTVMLKNMPNNQTRRMLQEQLDAEGFALSYDFVYLPYDFKTGASLGYGFVNFHTPEDALRAFERFEGYSRWTVPSRKVCGVAWSEPLQGLEANIERYRDSPVMHPDVPERFKPLILKNGKSVPFPPPTKKLRAPRLRESRGE